MEAGRCASLACRLHEELVPRLLSNKRNEADVRERLVPALCLAVAGDACENLRGHVFPDGDHEPAADRELRQQRGRRFRAACGDRDGIVGGVLGPSQRAVAIGHLDVVESESCQALLRRIRQLVCALDAIDLLRQPTEDGGGVPRAGSDFEDALATFEGECLRHERDDVRLRDRLPVADREGRVLVRELGELPGDERLS